MMGLGRLVALIDGVFAVALTLLVLDLKLPSGSRDLASALAQMLPGFVVYLIVFASVAGYWIIHHRAFRYVARLDARLTPLSLLNLVFITLFPLAASIVEAHPLEALTTICLSANGTLCCLSVWAIFGYAASYGSLLQYERQAPRLRCQASIMMAVGAALAAAIPAAIVSVYLDLAYAMWILGIPVDSLLLEKRLARS